MCKFFSAIITRDKKIVWDRNTNSHEDLLKKAGLEDDKLHDRDFVRIEYTQKTGKFSVKKQDWLYTEDEERTLPTWYVRQSTYFKEKCWKVLRKELKALKWDLLVKDITQIKKYPFFKPTNKPLKKWKLFKGKTWDAARDTARDAAWDAARDAARDAALDAAWDAAWDAARGAALDAARDVALLIRVKFCMNLGLKIAKKHIVHVCERIEVWKRGYGLLCDVDGKLYVYAKNKLE